MAYRRQYTLGSTLNVASRLPHFLFIIIENFKYKGFGYSGVNKECTDRDEVFTVYEEDNHSASVQAPSIY